MKARHLIALLTLIGLLALPAAAGAVQLRVRWLGGVPSTGTPGRLDRVGVVEVGSPRARNVLVLEPGTSAGGAYFVPLARWVARTLPGWQVWSVERRENLLEDQSELNLAKEGRATATQLFNYYLGWLADRSIKHHFEFIPDAEVAFARRWGMAVAVGDLHRVVRAARALGGHVVLGGHSLGGSVVTAYATWNFAGRPGADGLSGLVYDDGGSLATAPDTAVARKYLSLLASSSPWLAFGGISAPFAGLFSTVAATAALIDPDGASRAGSFSLVPAALRAPVPVTNLGEYGYALNVGTSPRSLAAAQAHLGRGLAASGTPRGWNGSGALTPIRRFATMFSGPDLRGIDGSEWYFPARLTLDTSAVDEGNANPAQAVLGLRATEGHHLPRRLLVYAFATSLGSSRVIAAARTLARQSHIPPRNVVLVNRSPTYAHNDPNGAYPRNAFFTGLIAMLRRAAR